MRLHMNDVLYVGPEQRTYQDRKWWVAKFVDDQGDYSDLELNIPDADVGKLPVPRSRVNVTFDLTKRNGREFKQNPVVTLVADKKAI